MKIIIKVIFSCLICCQLQANDTLVKDLIRDIQEVTQHHNPQMPIHHPEEEWFTNRGTPGVELNTRRMTDVPNGLQIVLEFEGTGSGRGVLPDARYRRNSTFVVQNLEDLNRNLGETGIGGNGTSELKGYKVKRVYRRDIVGRYISPHSERVVERASARDGGLYKKARLAEIRADRVLKWTTIGAMTATAMVIFTSDASAKDDVDGTEEVEDFSEAEMSLDQPVKVAN